ncbi:aquaporin-4-like isoform X2 [Tubulanus polymorphus]|uniref:aquaporin-4-like isoform X2 n=1 Tax=Tubulanus polymorphus TaxID=672921 RepID=UPI003DA22986
MSALDTITARVRQFLNSAMATSLDDLRSPVFWRGCVAECLGTMFLTFIGCGSCISWTKENSSPVQIGLAFGLAVGTLIWCLGNASGGHINPAVSVAMVVTGKISIARTMLYMFAQCGGAIVGAGILRGVTPYQVSEKIGATVLATFMTPAQGFGVEFLISFILVFTVFATCDTKRNDLKGCGPLAVGLAVVTGHLMAVNFTGSGMNPARSFGPAVVTGFWSNHWDERCFQPLSLHLRSTETRNNIY